MIPIILRELRDRKTSLFAYIIIGIGLLWMYVAIFPSIQKSAVEFEKVFQSYPQAIFQALGIQELTFNTLAKFLAVEQFSFVWPILAIAFTMSRAGNVFAGEIEKGTIGLFLALPVSRTKLFLSKYIAALVAILFFVCMSILAVIPLAALYGLTVSGTIILKLTAVSCLFVWAIFAATSFLSALMSERSKVYMMTGGALLIMYAANVVASLQESLKWLHHFSIFNYYNTQDILSKGDVHLSSILVFTGAIIIFTILGVIAFTRRDVSC